MKFFFPDSHDLVDPSFDFKTEQRAYSGSRQQSQQYAHEVFKEPPYDGLLVSKAVIDGDGSSCRYSFGQVQRLKRVGAREFFRLEQGERKRIETMGDCGSFSYVTEPAPPFSVNEVIRYYAECGFDYGISLDHVILGYDAKLRAVDASADWRNRFEMTLQLASEFRANSTAMGCRYTPLGAAQGWSPETYRDAVASPQEMGYDYIALGGMVPLKTDEILACLEAVAEVRRGSTKFHLLGISRLEQVRKFEAYGVASFDSTSPLKKAFKDDRDNYFGKARTYTAVRIPQVGENAVLKKLIQAGVVDHSTARRLEKSCLDAVAGVDEGSVTIDTAVERLREYERLWHGNKDDSERYRETLRDAPWRSCDCEVCRSIGIHVVLFRGAERNRRRGFHNVYALAQTLRR